MNRSSIWLVFLLFVFYPFEASTRDTLYVGSGSCASSNCHGGTSPKKDEFTIWSTQDKHAKAYGVLFNKPSQVMAKVLKLESSPSGSETCLKCHATAVPVTQRGLKFDINDGVGCESCHGAAGRWLEPHTRKDWAHEQSVKLGMYDNRSLVKRAENCLRCHSGIDHNLLAAGHPDIVFELDTFSGAMPKHWKEKQGWANARAWAMGQALALQRSMAATQERAKQGYLDWSDRNCFSCHHNIYDADWPIDPAMAGWPQWNSSRWSAFRHFLKAAFPEETKELSKKILAIEEEFRKKIPDTENVEEAAEKISLLMKELVPKINGLSWDASLIEKTIEEIRRDSDSYRVGGFRVAEQGLMAVDALSLALPENNPSRPKIRREVKKLYNLLDVKDPARYNPEDFSKEMESLTDGSSR